MEPAPTGAPAITTAATAAAFRGRVRLTSWCAAASALALAVPTIARTPADSALRFPMIVAGVVGLIGLPWATVAGIRIRLLRELLVAQPWAARWVEFRVDPVHGFDRHVEVLVRDEGVPTFDGVTKGRRLDRRARAVAEVADGVWWVCADQTGTFVLSPKGGEVLVAAKKLRDGPVARRVRTRFAPRPA